MSVTINAHQLGRLIDKTRSHIGSEFIEPLHGIRLEADTTHLYAVATDRYTIAAARYWLGASHDGQSVARTIPAPALQALREWLLNQPGHGAIEITTSQGRLEVGGPHGAMSIAVTDSLEFPDWRSLLNSIAAQATENAPFPALDSGYLGRWAASGDILRVRINADRKAVMVFGDDFIGAQMPARYAGIGPCTDETFEQAQALWADSLAAGKASVDMETGLPAEESRSRYEVTVDIRETGEELLRQTLRSGTDMLGKAVNNPDEFHAHATAGVHAWMAFRFLDALYTADPQMAASVVAETADQLDSGEIGEFAWDAAEKAGHDPQQWQDAYEAYLANRKANAGAAAV